MISTLLLFLFAALIISALCSVWEAVLLSITPAYVEIRQQRGEAIGRRLGELKANIGRPLAAILTLNTIANTVGAVGVGAEAVAIWGDANPLVTGVLVPALMTLAILLFSEIVPKTLGANFWQRLVPFTLYSLYGITFVLYPLVWLCQIITRRFRPDGAGSLFSRSDFLVMAEIGAREGVFARQESEIIHNLLQFDRVKTRTIMTPRIVVDSAPEEVAIEGFFRSRDRLPFTRIPVYRGDDKEDISGYIRKDELLDYHLRGRGDEPLRNIRRDILVVHDSLPITGLFNQLLARREHIALVVDEYGSMGGIVTMEDVIETLLGTEIVDELDDVESMKNLARERWLRLARAKGVDIEALDTDWTLVHDEGKQPDPPPSGE